MKTFKDFNKDSSVVEIVKSSVLVLGKQNSVLIRRIFMSSLSGMSSFLGRC